MTKRTRKKTKRSFTFNKLGPKEPEDEDRFFVIEKLLDKRYNKHGYEEYLVRWQNYSPDWDSWEPRHEIERNSLDMVLEYNRIHRGDEADDDSMTLHCICRKPYRFEDGGMIQCYNCYSWFHFSCLEMNMEEANLYAKYYCDDCRRINSTLKNMIKPDKLNTQLGKLVVERIYDSKADRI